MSPVTAELPMSGRKSKIDRDDKAVKIDRVLAVRASFIAEALGFTSMAEYLSDRLKPIIDADWKEANATLGKPKSS